MFLAVVELVGDPVYADVVLGGALDGEGVLVDGGAILGAVMVTLGLTVSWPQPARRRAPSKSPSPNAFLIEHLQQNASFATEAQTSYRYGSCGTSFSQFPGSILTLPWEGVKR